MSASLMTLIQASLLQERASDVAGPAKASSESLKMDPTVVERAVLGSVEPVIVKREAASPPSRAGNTMECLQQLVAAAAQLSDVDQMLEKVQQAVPAEDGAAQMWYQVSLRSLQWTRKAQSERFQAILKELKSVMMPLQGTTAERAAEPTSSPGDAWLLSMIPQETACDVSVAAAEVADVHGDGGDASREGLHDLEKVGSLRNDLEKLRKQDPDCCLIVRNIKRLGLESAESLGVHFSRFGKVADVYCAHSFEKPNKKRRHGRVRPAAVGFVVMETQEGAEKALAAGSDQSVGDVSVKVRLMGPFVDGELEVID